MVWPILAMHKRERFSKSFQSLFEVFSKVFSKSFQSLLKVLRLTLARRPDLRLWHGKLGHTVGIRPIGRVQKRQRRPIVAICVLPCPRGCARAAWYSGHQIRGAAKLEGGAAHVTHGGSQYHRRCARAAWISGRIFPSAASEAEAARGAAELGACDTRGAVVPPARHACRITIWQRFSFCLCHAPSGPTALTRRAVLYYSNKWRRNFARPFALAVFFS